MGISVYICISMRRIILLLFLILFALPGQLFARPIAPVWRDVAYKTVDSLSMKLDIYLPPDTTLSRPYPVIVYIHGGSWVTGSKEAFVIPYMEEGQALYLRCAFVPRYQAKKENNNEEKREITGYELRIRKVSLLANVIEELLKSFTLTLPADKIDAQFRKKLLKLLKQTKGKKPFNVRILEYKEKIAVELVSRKYNIDITAELIELIESYGFEYSIE